MARPDGAWGHTADPDFMTARDETFCQSCGEDHHDLSAFGSEIERCKVCGKWEHIGVDSQNGNWPGAGRCFGCWFKMPLRKRIGWIRWSLSETALPTPDEKEGVKDAPTR